MNLFNSESRYSKNSLTSDPSSFYFALQKELGAAVQRIVS